jgi:hypothetical protein
MSDLTAQAPAARPVNGTLPREVAMQIAGLAHVPDGANELFCDFVCERVEMIWRLDRRRMLSRPNPGPALLRAAKAARVLSDAISGLNPEDRTWVDNIVKQHPWLQGDRQRLKAVTEPFEVDGLEQTVRLLTLLFNAAIGKDLWGIPRKGAVRGKSGRRKGAVGDVMFNQLVHDILCAATENGGDLTIDKNIQTGTLVDALNTLRPYLPKGVVPNALPFSTLQKIKTAHGKNTRAFLAS